MSKNFVPQNSQFPRCIDGRMAVAIVEWNGAQWRLAKKGEIASRELGPQFLGGSLLFVKALEELAGKSREEALRMVEHASTSMGWGLQVHIDDELGETDITNLSEVEIIDFVSARHVGCGFAKYAWGEAGAELIMAAKDRHWRIEILTGGQEEKGATINYRLGYTFNTSQAVAEGQGKFNLDYSEAEKMFGVLGGMLKDVNFANQATSWMVETYKAVVVALNGVKTPEEIEISE